MLGSNPTRDNRLRRHHADGGRWLEILPSPFIMMLLFYALKTQ